MYIYGGAESMVHQKKNQQNNKFKWKKKNMVHIDYNLMLLMYRFNGHTAH